MTAGVPVVAGARGLDPRGRRRRRAARRADRRARARRRDHARPHRRRDRATSSSRAAAIGSARSRGTTPRACARRRATAGSRSRSRRQRMKVACHAGQLLQPVPGGIGRYVIATAPRTPARRASSRSRSRPARARARRRDGAVDRPRLAARQRALRAVAPPPAPAWCGSTPTSCTRRASRCRRCAARRSWSPCTTSRSCALPDVTTRRGVSFHRRGLELARRDARARDRAVGVHAAASSIREGFEPEQRRVAPLGVDPSVDRDPTTRSTRRVARVGVRAPYVLTVGTVEPRKDLADIVAALRAARARTPIPTSSSSSSGRRAGARSPGLDRPGVRVLGPQPWRRRRRARTGARQLCCIASRYEGFGLPALEALARGAPVVAADGSALDRGRRRRRAAVPARRRRRAARRARTRRSTTTPLRAELATARTAARVRRLHLGGIAPRRHVDALPSGRSTRLRAAAPDSVDSRVVRVLLDVSAVPARPVGAGVYTCAARRAASPRAPSSTCISLARRDDAERWATLAPERDASTPRPCRRPARLAWEQARAADARRPRSAPTCGTARTTRCRCASTSRGRHRARPHVLRPSRVARAQQGRRSSAA